MNNKILSGFADATGRIYRVGEIVRVNDTLDTNRTIAVRRMKEYRGLEGKITRIKYPYFIIEGMGAYIWEGSNVTLVSPVVHRFGDFYVDFVQAASSSPTYFTKLEVRCLL